MIRTLIRGPVLALAAGLTLLSGCLDYQETIEVLPDGRIELTLFTTIVDAARPAIENRPGMRDLLRIPDSREQAQRRLPPDFGLKHWVVTRGKGFHIYDISVTAPSPAALREWLGGFSGEQQIEIVEDGDTIRYRRVLPPTGGRRSPEIMQMIKLPADKGRMAFRMIVPTEFIETNGRRDGKRISTWQIDMGSLRHQGLVMEAVIRRPGLQDVVPPWGMAAAAAALGIGIGLFVLRRRRAT
jgi:hypothetical protein